MTQHSELLDWGVALHAAVRARDWRLNSAVFNTLATLFMIGQLKPLDQPILFPCGEQGKWLSRPFELFSAVKNAGTGVSFTRDFSRKSHFTIDMTLEGYRTGANYDKYLADIEEMLDRILCGTTPQALACWAVTRSLMHGSTELEKAALTYLEERAPQYQGGQWVKPNIAAVGGLVRQLAGSAALSYLRRISAQIDACISAYIEEPERPMAFGL